MKRFLSLLLFLTTVWLSDAQNFQKEFNEQLQKQDTIAQLSVLNKWQQKNPQDAELFLNYFKYYFFKARKERTSISQQKGTKKSFALKDSTARAAAYLDNNVHYKMEVLQKGMAKINDGIALYPDRLDMRFGKIYALGEIKDWENFTKEIIKTLLHSKNNADKWLWAHNEPLAEGQKMLLSAVQDYQVQLYNTGSDKLLNAMQKIAKQTLLLSPKHVPSLSNLAITYLIQKEYDKALESLLQAEKLAPNDGIVLSNIAKAYELKADKLTSIVYYKKIVENPEIKEEIKEFAKEKIRSSN